MCNRAGCTISYGECHCGCGGKTHIARVNKTREGHVKGQPIRFINHHHKRLSPVPYVERCGPLPTPCWIWKLSCSGNGYGSTKVAGKTQSAHVVYYEHMYGRIPAGMELHHMCKTPSCVNPMHLKPLTIAEHNRIRSTTKLTVEDVVHIRKENNMLQREIAKMYGISRSGVSGIRTRRSWKDI